MTLHLLPSTTEIYLCTPDGIRTDCLDYCAEYSYSLIANDIAPFTIKLPASFDRKKVQLDNIIEIWRGFGPGTLKLDYCGFVQGWRFADDAGLEYTELYGYSSMELLKRRVVANYAGSAQAKMTDEADDLLKAVAKDQLGSDASAARNLTSMGGGFTLQADLSDGQSLTKEFSYDNVLELFQEVANASAQAGTNVYFDIVPIVSSATTGALAFQFQTFTDQRGNDRTWDSYTPVYIGPAWGNLENGSLDEDHSEEINYCYVLGAGEGESRETTEVSDTARLGMSIWNRREGVKDARNLEAGDTAARTAEGNTYLSENKPKLRFSGDVIETPSFRYGRDWYFGDRVTADYAGRQLEAMLDKIVVSRDESGQEKISAKLEVEA